MKNRSSIPKQPILPSKSRPQSNRTLRNRTRRSVRSRPTRREERTTFTPPENWYEPSGTVNGQYRIISQPPGTGYQHVVTPDEIRTRLGKLPSWMLSRLEVVQLSRMTQKKERFPCYGMQWGATLYLYPMEIGNIEFFWGAPEPNFRNEVRMYGGRFKQYGPWWELIWSPAAIKDFYLNNILIHELGHLLDDRNQGYHDRERYAEWFAIEYGYKPSRETRRSKARRRPVRRRHRNY